MLAAVPISQLFRRLQIVAWKRLEPQLLPKPPQAEDVPIWRQDLPQPVFPPRSSQLLQTNDGNLLNLAWGQRPLTIPMEWLPALNGRIDGSWRARLHYMEYLEAADSAFAEALINDWINQVRLDQSDARQFGWRAFNLSIRAAVWMQQAAARYHEFSGPLLQQMAASLCHQLIYLERHLETDLRGNHLIKNMKALLWAGYAFEGAKAKHWRALGEKLLESEIREQVLADGCHYERSPAYHCQVLADFCECLQLLPPGGLRERLQETIDGMADALVSLVHPDGLVAQFNDGGLTMAYLPAQCLEAATHDGKLPDGAFKLPAAGFYGHRAGGDYIIADCGALAPSYLIGHGHGDILSFEWSINGKRIIVDQGTYQNLGGERRKRSRATASHNTVTIKGLDQGDFYGAHRCGRRPKALLEAFEPVSDGFDLTGSHDGFAHLPGKPIHRRNFRYRLNELLITDHIEGSGDWHQHARGSLLLHPACRVERAEDALIVHRDDEKTLHITADVPLDIEEAEWYPDLYCAHATSRLVYQFAENKTVSLKLTKISG